MSDGVNELKNHQPTKDFFIAIDSDGCAFDTMEIKHKECFIPNIVKYWDLQPVSKFARAAAEFVNLYSKWRGINRFPALTMAFDLLADWDKVQQRNVKMPDVPNPALKAYCAEHPEEADMQRALEWSVAVNKSVEDIVYGVPPFPGVRESLIKAGQSADILVCSATPVEALVREWEEHGIDQYVFYIAGQEQGKKAEHIQMAAGGKYDPSHMLMIGDAEGDLSAAKKNNALFYPINPGEEEASWARFHDEALGKFLAGEYAGEYEAALIAEFKGYLPEVPPWKK